MFDWRIRQIGKKCARPETVQFFESLITEYLQQNKYLTIALEIASNQQSIIDKVMLGKAVVANIEISSIINHTPFRSFINDMVELRKDNNCLQIIAVDGWVSIDTTRDEWMSKILNERACHSPVLALLGNLHTLKKVDWNLAMTKGKLYVAGILESQGRNVKTYPQMRIDRACKARNRFITADTPEAPSLLNSKLISLLNAFDSEVVTDTIDGIILWECDT